jgi:NADPH-dependent ferric siderophore reductase
MYAEVTEVERLSPSMVRVVLGGGELEAFEPTPFTDQYVNAYFVPDDAPYTVPFDLDDVRSLGGDVRPRPRRFTVRSWDETTKRLTIDFVAHGDVGHAGRWAQRTAPGDRLQFAGPGGGYAPRPDADWHLLAGDESALPAIAASLERLSPGARAIALIVVDGPANELPLDSPGEVEVVWVHRSTATDPETALPDAVAALEFPAGVPQVFVHGEAGEVRAIRRHLAAERGVDVEGASISPYWRRDCTDEAWREIKAQWMAEMKADR